MSIGRRQSIMRWVGQYWDDLKASVDPSLLAIARFFGLLYGPIDHKSRFGEALRKSLARRLPSYAGWRQAMGGITYLLFMVLVGTGVLLAFYYRPSAQEAYSSVQHIVTQVTFGWLIRDLHHWGANLIVIAVLAHMARVFFLAAYHPPRETNWFIGLVLLFVVLAFGASGYLLPWDQWAYWSTTDVLGAVAAVPVVGGAAADAITGDEIVSGATLSRFFSIHVILLPWIALVLLSLHFALQRKHGTSPPPDAVAGDQLGVPFFPHHVLRMLIATVLVLAVLFTFAVLYPRPVGTPADPYQVPDQLVSTWLLIDVSRGLTAFLGAWGLLAFALVGLSLALFPLFDRGPHRKLRQRPVVAFLGVAFFLGFVAAWFAGRQLRSVVPSISPERQAVLERAPLPPSRVASPPDSLSIQSAPPPDTTGRSGGQP